MTSHEPHRFEPEHYERLGSVVSFVAITKNRTSFFAREAIARDTIRIIEEHARLRRVFVASYCLMPDHMHIDVGPSEECGALQFVNEVKSFSARAAWAHGVHRTIWQRSYWDVIVEPGLDGVRAAMAYTLCNPEDGELVKKWTDHPYCGSLVYPRDELIAMVPPGVNCGRAPRGRRRAH
jgi:REP element-mobilizing transposase RayT